MTDKTGKVHGIINGTWDEFIEYAPVVNNTTSVGGEKPVLETGPPIQLWRVSPLPPDAEKMYNFTQFAIQLNDKPENEPNLCPTDCRLRPDQRLMEEGLWDEANAEKVRLEDKQRLRRRNMALKLINKESSDDGASSIGGSSSTTSNANVPASLMGEYGQCNTPRRGILLNVKALYFYSCKYGTLPPPSPQAMKCFLSCRYSRSNAQATVVREGNRPRHRTGNHEIQRQVLGM